MSVTAPHYLLSCETSRTEDHGLWRFVFHTPEGVVVFEASDEEPEVRGQRLDLLTVVRALESLDQPTRVTLAGCSAYVRQGIEHGLPEWRANGWRWEFFGQMVPVKNCDLWQRMDRIMRFHQVHCRRRRFDLPHQLASPAGLRPADGRAGERAGRRWRVPLREALATSRRQLTGGIRLWRRRISALWRLVSSRPTGRVSAGTVGSSLEAR